MKLLRMREARPKKHMELEERMRRLLFTTMIPMTCLMILLLIIFWHYAGQYNELSENLAVSSEFNLRFKDDLDLEMYYIAIGSKESSELEDVLGQVEDAQAIMQKLRQNTYHASGMKSLKSLESYLDNLKKRMIQLTEIKEYDKRMEFMDSNIRIITSLIMQEMQHLTELQLIQAQVNPHFLYNTLDTIVWLIEGGMTEDAVDMISSLSVFFRTSLSKGNDIIPLSEEERHTLSYLEIQQYRYRDILEFEIHIPEELGGIPVPKLSIQPLAENAIYHGIKNRRGKGKILIEGREEGDALVLTVSDNGQGMTPERLHEVQEAIRTGKRAGFGLAAVAERISLYYGPGYGMQISSEEGKGTTIEIRLGKNIQPKS